jgi:predicted nuclease of predicted toxin-antitoxin system
VKLWIDECLSPALVGQAHGRGYEATCTRDRGQLGLPDDELIVLAVDEGFAFVTNNHADFRSLCASAELHAGLVILPQGRRDDQRRWLDRAIAHIERRAADSGESPADWMLNRVVDVDPDTEACIDAVLPGG